MNSYFDVHNRHPEPISPELEALFINLEYNNHHADKSDLAKTLESCNGPIVDVGCGTGHLAFNISKLTNNPVIGIDNNDTAIKKAKQKYQRPNLEFIQGDGYRLSESISHAALIISHYSLHHFELAPALDSMSQILLPNGEMWIFDFDRLAGITIAQRGTGAKLGIRNMEMLQEGYKRGDVLQTIEDLNLMSHPNILTYISMQAAYRHNEVQKALTERGFGSIADANFEQGSYQIISSRKLRNAVETNEAASMRVAFELANKHISMLHKKS